MAEHEADEQIAIVGMAGRFPGAPDVDSFWANIRDGVESIRPFSDAELAAAGADIAAPGFVNAGAVMEGHDGFDASFFGMTRREAELTDPQHRVFLEAAWAAVEHAGYDVTRYEGRVGVFGGVAANTYFRNNLMAHPDLLARTGDYPLLLATEREYAITRTAYKLSLQGPALSVNTACSTSAVSVHLAIQSLLAGESDMALAGGARIKVPATAGYIYQEDGILSPDGHCRPFDLNARGTVPASGVAIVVLKRLVDAHRDRDRVYAVIRGSAVNNDGAAKIGFTAPGVEGQAAVIEEALAVAGVDASTIGMLEAHGTATRLGDPIEVAALTRAYRRDTDRRGYCAIGSLKSNIGHLDAGAGAAGIIKAALSLYHEQIPPSINFSAPNPEIDFEASPFFVNTEPRPWPRADQPRRAGVSSFGLGGTNAHVVLEEAPAADAVPLEPTNGPHVLTLSAKTATALAAQRQALADHLEANPRDDLAAVAFTLAAGRGRMRHRDAIAAQDTDDAVRRLRDRGDTAVERASTGARVEVAFVFPGQGAQHPGMARGPYRHEPVFRAAVDECAELLTPRLGVDLRTLMFPHDIDTASAARRLDEASLAQPATFIVQYALARLWQSWGVRPAVMVGHSLGEFAAACLGGVFSLADALRLVATRGRLMQELGGGSMMAILAEPEAVAPLLDDETAIAAVNAPTQVVASGPIASIDGLEARLTDAGIRAHRLPIGLAAHSAMMEPMVEPLRDAVARADRGRLGIPMISTVTGDRLGDDDLADPGYWATHARSTVRFAEAMARLLEQPDLVVLEVGPGQTLTGLVGDLPDDAPDRVVLASLPHQHQAGDDRDHLRGTAAELWAAGVDVDVEGLTGAGRMRTALPTYPFERGRYWVDVPAAPAIEVPRPAVATAAQPATALASEDAGGQAADRPARSSGDTPVGDRKQRIEQELVAILSDLSGIEAGELDLTADFADLGFDSLFLTQANSQFRRRFGVRITFRQLFEEAPSIDRLAGFIDSKLDPAALPAPASFPSGGGVGSSTQPRQDAGSPAAPNRLEDLIREQSRLLEQQLELIRQGGLGAAVQPVGTDERAIGQKAPSSSERPTSHYLATSHDGPRHTPESHALSEQQQAAIEALVERTNARTAGSKRRAARWRPSLADNRTIVGFDKAWKELVYQIVSERSHGSRIWDVDGNEYVDTAMGYGTNLFGHSPEFVVEAVRAKLQQGYEVGAQNHVLGEVTEAICRLSGNERLAYTTSGGEAVETAIRVARTVTSRDKVVYFTDDIHGRSDIVLGRGLEQRGVPRTVPMVAGVPQRVMDDALVLEYGSDHALDVIRAQSSELALVLVEPVRTRNPDLQPVDFMRALRSLADETGFLLVFDEIVTGFRAHQGGVQALFDVRADITTYGKVIGGGLPIGVMAGRSDFVDVIDGGPWAFGDDSFPEADITASGGTFIKHPLTLAAAHAVLGHLEGQGPSLQAQLTARTSAAVAAINDAYRQDGLPIHIEHFSSFFRPTFTASTRFAGLFQYYLREHGVHTNPPSPSFLSTAHSEADIEAVVDAYIEAGRAMDRADLLEPHAPAGGDVPRGGTPIPVLPNVARFLLERDTPQPHHWNLGVLLRTERPMEPERTRRALEHLVERHDALRLRFAPSGPAWTSSIAASDEAVPFVHHDLTDLPEDERRPALERIASEVQGSLDLEAGPIFRMVLFDQGGDDQRLLVIIHHFAMDGISWRPFWQDFEAIYADLERGSDVSLAPASTSFAQWAQALEEHADASQLGEDIAAWQSLPWDRVRPIPTDHGADPELNTNASARQVSLDFSGDETNELLYETPAVAHKTDLLLTTLAEVLARWSGSDTALFDLMGHGRDEDSFGDVDLFESVGFFISYTPMVLTVPGQDRSDAPVVASEQIRPLLARGLTFDLLRYMSTDTEVRRDFGALPRAQVLFNHLGKRDEIDAVPRGELFSLASESIGLTHSPTGRRYYPLAISSEIWKEQLRLKFVFSERVHQRATIDALAADFRGSLLERVHRARDLAIT